MTATAPQHQRADFTRVDPGAIALLAERWARRHGVLPLWIERGTLCVATADPLDYDAERAVAFATGHRVSWQLASPDELVAELNRWYPDSSRPERASPPTEVQHITFATDGAAGAHADDTGASIIRLVDQLLADGIAAGASDIHLEPEEQGVAVRHRVDGVLRHARLLPRSVASSLVSRVKILSGLDIADRMRPQDGRARVSVRGAVVDLRVSTLPASHGEKIVIRVLDGSGGLRSLDSIGFDPADLSRIRQLLEQREGLVLVTGPTGSGKTTTLYAALREIQARGVNVVTVEDPIEYRLPGIVQVQVHERAGLTFGAALRSIMRQDPDVILIGEIRDRETAEIAIQASLTGHLVLSTLHTNDATSAITRLIDIGVPGYQIATAVKGVMAQRLVRRVCAECESRGCAACDMAGYRGRIAIAEILISDGEFERRVAAGASGESLTEAARRNGCVSLWSSGTALVRRGATTIDELRRVAAEPVRAVMEPAAASASALPGIFTAMPSAVPAAPVATIVRIAWMTPSGTSPRHAAQLQELRVAALRLGSQVEILADSATLTAPEVEARSPDVTIVPLTRASSRALEQPGSPGVLRIALAHGADTSDHVSALLQHADVVLPVGMHGRLVLATVLALLRWRRRVA